MTTILLLWLWCLSAVASPSLVWEEYTADSERWKNKKTEGFIVLPLAPSTYELAPTPLVWEIRSVDGKAHMISIRCDLYGDVLYESEWIVESISKGSAVIPIQGASDYDQLQCFVSDEEDRQLQTVTSMSSLSGVVEHSKVVFIDAPQSRERFPEWMIATQTHREDADFVQVSESDWVPTDFVAYMGVRTVVWFANERPITPMQEEALRDWVQFGGHLIVVGAPNFRIRAAWSNLIDERFTLSMLDEQVLPIKTAAVAWMDLKSSYSIVQQRQFKQLVEFEYSGYTDIESYRVGRGQVTLVDESSSVQEALTLLVNPWANQTGFFAGFQQKDSVIVFASESIHPFFEGYEYSLNRVIKSLGLFELVPEELILLLLFIFSMVIGPINMFMKGSRLHWIWRTPLIAVVCTLIVLLINWQLMTSERGQSVEFAIWDARSNDLLVRKERVYFVNSSDLETGSVVAHTRLLPIRSNRDSVAVLQENKDGSTWKDLSKMRQVHPILSWHKLPQRRGVRVENGTVYNDLDVPLEQLLFRDLDGTYWASDTVPSGGSQSLTEVAKKPTFLEFYPSKWRDHDMISMHWDQMPRHTVLFVLKDKVIWDGLESSNGDFDKVDSAISDVHTIVYGVLP